ncbi:uncharacterized protein PG986_013031 [Apiospora aurea]|uniref:Uncharacterized protein n=1 Tax=Apiospora aurea TaxID=335848 RepID=A0ABR1Q1P8_9PEZI
MPIQHQENWILTWVLLSIPFSDCSLPTSSIICSSLTLTVDTHVPTAPTYPRLPFYHDCGTAIQPYIAICPGSGAVGIPHIPYENIELPDDEYSDLEQYHFPGPIAIDNTPSNHESDEEAAYRASNSITVNFSMRQRANSKSLRDDNKDDNDDNLFLVKFVHINCPGPTRCDPWQAVDVSALMQHRVPPPHGVQDGGRHRRQTPRPLPRAPPRGLRAQRRRRPRAAARARRGEKTVTVPETGETATSFFMARITSVYVHWAPMGGYQGGGMGVGSNLFDMNGVETVQRQLRMVRLRGHRDWVGVRYETLEHVHVYPAEPENEGDVVGEGRGSGTDKSLDREPSPEEEEEEEEEEESSSGNGNGNGNGNGGGGGSVDAEMNSPPAAATTRPSSSHGYDEEGSDIEQMPLYSMTLHDGASGAGVEQQQQQQQQEQQEQQQGDESSQEIPAPDSQGLIW